MKAIKGLIITLVVIVALVGVTIIGGYIYVRSTYGIDLFRTAGQLKTLSQTPDEKTLCPNAFSANDMADVKAAMDKNLNGLISYNEGEGYEGYKVDFSAITSPMPFADDIVFSSKQAGALAQTIFFGQTGGVVKIGEKELSVRLVQMNFANVSENGSAENMNLQIGTTAINALIGNSDNAGFAYSLQALGKTTFKFTSADGGSIVIA